MSEPLEKLLNSKQVALVLNCHIKTVHRMARSKKLPVACMIGTDYRFNPDAIRQWVTPIQNKKRRTRSK